MVDFISPEDLEFYEKRKICRLKRKQASGIKLSEDELALLDPEPVKTLRDEILHDAIKETDNNILKSLKEDNNG